MDICDFLTHMPSGAPPCWPCESIAVESIEECLRALREASPDIDLSYGLAKPSASSVDGNIRTYMLAKTWRFGRPFSRDLAPLTGHDLEDTQIKGDVQ